jgi:hypothetical protein
MRYEEYNGSLCIDKAYEKLYRTNEEEDFP